MGGMISLFGLFEYPGALLLLPLAIALMVRRIVR